jgi:phage baseplate assembly protein W
VELANKLLARATLGKGLASPLTVDPATGDFKKVSEEENVANCILDLILTRVGERVMNEDIGNEMPQILFDNIDGAEDILPIHVIDVIRRYEPRVRDVAARVSREGDTKLVLSVGWILKATGQPGNVVYPFYAQGSEGGVE